jgi:N,N'-diacetyllegionaminate synthase
MPVFIIAEAGVNHNGDADLAMELVEIAHRAGADAIKFQTFKAESLVTETAEKAEYQKRATGEGSQIEMLKALEMSKELHFRLFDRCQELGIAFMSTAFDEELLSFLIELGMHYIKVPSGELINHPFLKAVASYDLPIILSTGMGDMDEIQEAVAVISDVRKKSGFSTPLEDRLTILHCTSNYPAAPSDVNLKAMQSIAHKTGLPIGYSDHTLGPAIPTAAVGMGATIIEKHFTTDRNLPGPDHKASLEPDELTEMIKYIRGVEAALGDGVKAPTESEQNVRAVARRSVVIRKDLPAGHIITFDDIHLLRPASGIAPKYYDKLSGRILKQPVAGGTPLQWSDLVSD